MAHPMACCYHSAHLGYCAMSWLQSIAGVTWTFHMFCWKGYASSLACDAPITIANKPDYSHSAALRLAATPFEVEFTFKIQGEILERTKETPSEKWEIKK